MLNNCYKDVIVGRFLVSFAGKYLSYDYHVVFPRGKVGGDTVGSVDHEFCKIYIPHTEPKAFGPAFIEVGSLRFYFLHFSLSWSLIIHGISK